MSSNDDVRAAYALIGKWDADDSGTYLDLANAIAAALAAEREKARAQALRDAADAWDGKGAGRIKQLRIGMGTHSGASVASWLRRAAEDAQ